MRKREQKKEDWGKRCRGAGTEERRGEKDEEGNGSFEEK